MWTADTFTRRGRERPYIQIALQNLASMKTAIGKRPALIARRDRDRARSLGHSEAIGACAVEACYQSWRLAQCMSR